MPTGKNRTTRIPEQHPEAEEELDLEEGDFEDEFDVEAMVTAQIEKANRIINEQHKKLESRVDDHEHRIINMEKQFNNISESIGMIPSAVSKEPEKQKTNVDRFLDMTLGTAGRALHAVVDTVAFIGESTVDIITLGRGRPSK